MRRLGITAFAVLALTVNVPALAKKKAEMTPMELQALQTHEYEASKEVLFASVVSVFQDLGYQLENADMPSGFITASSATRNKTGLLEAFAGMQSSGNTRATAFVEAMPSGVSRVRLNFLNSRNTSSRYGQSSKDDKPILDQLTYKSAWDKIDQAIFMRVATNGSAKPNAPVTATASPATISVPVTPGTSVIVVPPAPPK